MFTMKRDLKQLQKENNQPKEKIQCRKSGRSASGTSRECGKLGKACIFCRRVKHLKGEKQEKHLLAQCLLQTKRLKKQVL